MRSSRSTTSGRRSRSKRGTWRPCRKRRRSTSTAWPNGRKRSPGRRVRRRHGGGARRGSSRARMRPASVGEGTSGGSGCSNASSHHSVAPKRWRPPSQWNNWPPSWVFGGGPARSGSTSRRPSRVRSTSSPCWPASRLPSGFCSSATARSSQWPSGAAPCASRQTCACRSASRTNGSLSASTPRRSSSSRHAVLCRARCVRMRRPCASTISFAARAVLATVIRATSRPMPSRCRRAGMVSRRRRFRV